MNNIESWLEAQMSMEFGWINTTTESGAHFTTDGTTLKKSSKGVVWEAEWEMSIKVIVNQVKSVSEIPQNGVVLAVVDRHTTEQTVVVNGTPQKFYPGGLANYIGGNVATINASQITGNDLKGMHTPMHELGHLMGLEHHWLSTPRDMGTNLMNYYTYDSDPVYHGSDSNVSQKQKERAMFNVIPNLDVFLNGTKTYVNQKSKQVRTDLKNHVEANTEVTKKI